MRGQLAMFECSQIHLPSQADVRDSPNLSPKPLPASQLAPPAPPDFQPQRVSLASSDPASTTFSLSDNDRVFSSGDEDSMEFQSEPAFGSVAAKPITSNNSDVACLDIESRLEESPPPEAAKDSVLPLEGLVPRRSFGEPSQRDASYRDELNSLSTPKHDQSKPHVVDDLATPVAARDHQPKPQEFQSSPPSTPSWEDPPHETVSAELVPAKGDGLALCDGELWDEDIHLESTSWEQLPSPELPQHASRRLSPPMLGTYHLPLPQHTQCLDDIREERRLSIFDWSEQQRSDRDSPYCSSPRPRTVHSKQGNDVRGGRVPGRRAPNALHLRSQSVPVAKESHMDSDPAYPPAKFGTWGLGNKGVSEEWTDDFEFDEVDGCDAQHSAEGLGTGMKVPQAIIDRQASVHGQFGQVQEFMLLVEELKRLRHQGILLELMDGPSHHLWEDAENIINLATLNEDDEDPAPPQSPGFASGFDDFDEGFSPAHRPRQQYNPITEDEWRTVPNTTLSSAPATPPTGRPRGESLAQAKSFLQTMHQNRARIESSLCEDRSHLPKLPFDTQDLRDLVTRTGVVTRGLKDVVRKAEGVFTSPDRASKEPRDPPFSQIFNRPESLSPTSRKPGLPKSTSVNSYVNGSLSSSNNERDRPGHMSMMTVA
jgi:Septation protein etd1